MLNSLTSQIFTQFQQQQNQTRRNENLNITIFSQLNSTLRFDLKESINMISFLKLIAQSFNELKFENQISIISYLSKFYSRRELRKIGFKFCNAAFTSIESAQSRKRNRENQDESQRKKRKYEDTVLQFLQNNSEIAANRMIKINHSDVPVRLLNDNCTSLYNQYSLEFPDQEVSYSTFKRCMPKNFKKSKKETNFCGYCENRKTAIIQYSKISNELKELKLSKVSKKEISKKQKELDKVCDKKKEYEKHYEHKNVQRECFNKIKQNIPNNTLLLVLDFKKILFLKEVHEKSIKIFTIVNQEQFLELLHILLIKIKYVKHILMLFLKF